MTGPEGTATYSSGSKNFINDNAPVSNVPYYSSIMDVRKSKAVDAEQGEQDAPASALWTYLMTDVDPAQSTGPLTAFCFMTGYMCVVQFSSSYPSDFNESLSRNLEMRFPFQPSSYGVGFKPATSYR